MRLPLFEVTPCFVVIQSVTHVSLPYSRLPMFRCHTVCYPCSMRVEEFRHAQYSALPTVEWQQRGRKHGPCFARSHHRSTAWRSAVSLGQKEWNLWKFTVVCWLRTTWVNERFMSGWKGLSRFEHVLLVKVVLVGHQHRVAEKLLLRRNTETSWTI